MKKKHQLFYNLVAVQNSFIDLLYEMIEHSGKYPKGP